MFSVFIAPDCTSPDGFIAQSNPDFDVLPAGGREAHGYEEFKAGVDRRRGVSERFSYQRVPRCSGQTIALA
jgi:hypothetical protein